MAVARAVAAGCFAVLLLAACEGAPPGLEEVTRDRAPLPRDTARLFQTDSLTYGVRAGASIEGTLWVTLTNRTAGPMYFVNCGGRTRFHLEKWEESAWRHVWAPVAQLCLSPPIVVAVGEQLRFRIDMWAAREGSNVFPQFTANDVEGEYRLVWGNVLASYVEFAPHGELLPFDARVSNRFRLAVQAP